MSGQYDPQSGQFLVRHADGTDIEIDIHKIRRGALIVPMFGSSITELYVFYRNRRDGKIYPRVFDENSTPNLVLMAREIAEALPGAVALRQIGHAILDLIEWMSLKPNMSRGVGRKAWRVKPRTLRDTASALVRQLRKAGKRIRVNLGGTGEVADAINLNPNRVAPRADIPNLLQGEGENIGDLFEAGSVDEIVSNRLPPNTINWNQVIPGAAKVLRSGGRIVIKFQGVGEDARIIVEAMKAAKFRNIQNMADAVIEAIR